MKELKQKLILLGFIALAFVPSWVFAQSQTDDLTRCANLKSQFKGLFDWVDPRYCTIEGFLLWVLQQGLLFAGIIATLFIIIGGYKYLIAQGDDDQAEEGKKTLRNAVIGLVVILLASVIVRIAVNAVTGNIMGGGNGTQNTGGGGTQNPGTGSGGVTLGAAVSLPASGFAGRQFTVQFVLPHGSAAQLRENQNAILRACSLAEIRDGDQNSAFGSTQFELYINNQKVGYAPFSVNLATDIRSTVTSAFPQTPGSVVVSARVCGSEIKSQTVSVVSGSGSGPTTGTGTGSGEENYESRFTACLNEIGNPNECERRLGQPTSPSGSSAVQAAANGSAFSVSKTGDKQLRVSVSSSTSSMMLMCNLGSSFSRLSEGSLEVFVNGQSKSKVSLNTDYPRNVTVTLQESIVASMQVRVEICGHVIGGGEKTFNPPAR